MTSTVPSVPTLRKKNGWSTLTDGCAVQGFCVSFLLASGSDKCVAVCCFAVVPAWHHISRLMQRVAADRVHVPCGAALPGAFFYLWPLEKLCVHGRVIMNYLSAVAAARTTSAGSCWHEVVRNVCQVDKVRTLLRHSASPDGLLGRPPPWRPMAAHAPNLACHFFWHAAASAASR